MYKFKRAQLNVQFYLKHFRLFLICMSWVGKYQSNDVSRHLNRYRETFTFSTIVPFITGQWCLMSYFIECDKSIIVCSLYSIMCLNWSTMNRKSFSFSTCLEFEKKTLTACIADDVSNIFLKHYLIMSKHT